MKPINNKILGHIIEINNSQSSWWIISLICLCPLVLLAFTQLDTSGPYVLAGIFGIILVALSIAYPIFWVYSTVVLLPLYLISRDTKINPMEIAVYSYILSGLLIWFVSILLVKREKIVYNWGDFFLILFIIFSLFNIIIAYLNDVNLLNWFKDYSLYCLYLLYFPYRYYLKSESSIKTFLIILSISLILIAGYQLYHFREVAIMATFAYELQGTLRINLTILAFGTILGIFGVFRYKEISIKLIMLALIVLSIGVVITSFARTTWIIEMFLFLLLFSTLNRKQKIITASISLATVLIISILAISLMSNLDIYWKMINKKFISTGDGKKDISLMSRVVEYKAVWKAIEENPISGNGLAKIYAHKNLLSEDQSTLRKTFTHNSFLQLVYNLGTPTALAMTIFVFYYFFVSFKLTFWEKLISRKEKFYPFLSFTGFVIAIIHAMVSPQFISKETVILIVISVLLINFSVDSLKHERIQSQY